MKGGTPYVQMFRTLTASLLSNAIIFRSKTDSHTVSVLSNDPFRIPRNTTVMNEANYLRMPQACNHATLTTTTDHTDSSLDSVSS